MSDQVAKSWKMIKASYVTSLECAQRGGCLALSQRVSEWRAQGHVIGDKWVTTAGGARVKAYKLLKEKKPGRIAPAVCAPPFWGATREAA